MCGYQIVLATREALDVNCPVHIGEGPENRFSPLPFWDDRDLYSGDRLASMSYLNGYVGRYLTQLYRSYRTWKSELRGRNQQRNQSRNHAFHASKFTLSGLAFP